MIVSIVGCGWLGLPLGKKLVSLGDQIKGSTTTHQKLDVLSREGILPFYLKVDQFKIVMNDADLFECHTLVINLPPGRNQDNVELTYPAQIKWIIKKAKEHNIQHIVFVSSTGVYTNTNALTDENGSCKPTKLSGRAMLMAESHVRDSDIPWTILRMSGLVGGSRQPGKWFSGKVGIPNGDTPVNMIHRDDCLEALNHIIHSKATNDIFNLSAGMHPIKKDFYKAQSIKIGVKAPGFLDGIAAHKIVDNSKFKTVFNFEYLHDNPCQF